MSTIGSSQGPNLGHVPPQVTDPKPVETHEAPKPYVAKSDTAARAAQTEILRTFEKTPLSDRKVTLKTLISKDGLEFAIGKATKYARLKDSVLRFLYKVGHRHNAGTEVGSLHKTALRQADEYRQLVKTGAPESQRLAVLNSLKGTLQDMQAKLVAKGRMTEDDTSSPISKLLKFVGHEISGYPTEHLKAGKELMATYDGELAGPEVTLAKKLECLYAAQDHLLAAKEAGALDEEGVALLGRVEGEIPNLESRVGLKGEIRSFGQRQMLKPTHTRESDVVSGMRAKHRHEQFLEKAGKDPERELLQEDLGKEIESFDQSRLKHVETDERTGLKLAQDEFSGRSIWDQVVSEVPGLDPKPKAPVVKDPTITDLTPLSLESSQFQEMGERLLEALQSGDPEELESLALVLGSVLANDIKGMSPDQRLGFTTSHGEALKNSLIHLIAGQQPGREDLSGDYQLEPGDGSISKELKSFLDKAYTIAVSSLDDRQVDETTLVLDGVTYTKVKELGRGGYATVDLYEGMKDGVKVTIAVKEPILLGTSPEELRTLKEKAFKECANEARIHRSSTLGDPEQVLGFKGAIQTADGRILIAMEAAPHGTLFDFKDRLKEVEKSGHISPQAATLIRITLLKDLLLGMKHVQETRGITHLDYKSPNVLIGGGGVAKMIDFGTSTQGLEMTLKKSPVDNPIYLAPEVIVSKNLIGEGVKEISDSFRDYKRRAREELKKLEGKEKEEFGELIKETTDHEVSDSLIERYWESVPGFEVTEKADTWSLGITAYELFFGEPPFDDPRAFMAKVEDMVTEFAKDPESRISTLGKDGEGNPIGTGVGELDRLLNQMLHPVPSERPTISDLLEHSLFKEPGVDEPDVRELIKLISDPTTPPEVLKTASDKLGV